MGQTLKPQAQQREMPTQETRNCLPGTYTKQGGPKTRSKKNSGYNEHGITNDTSTTQTNADDIQPLQTNPPVVTLRHSQRTIRKPERYCDSNY